MNRVLSSFTNGPVLDAVWMKCRYYYATILNNIILLSEGKHNNKNLERIVSSVVSSTTLHEIFLSPEACTW